MERYSEYKDSGVQWLGEIPGHWKEERAKYLYKKEQRPIEEGDDIVTCFRDGEVTLRKNRRTTGFTEATDYSHYQHICKGDLVIHQMDAFAGSSGVSDSDGMGTPVLSVCTAKIGGLNHYYYAYILRLMGKNNFILSLYRGIRERSSDFRFETFAKQYLPVPPALEQEQIVNFINERSSKIDALTGKLQKEIESIKEYKQRLISDVVTGQIKVC
jgi:type I restriction enzyme S subunit